MTFEIDGEEYNVLIEKKKSTKNTYIRVKDDLTIYVTTNRFCSDNYIIDLLIENCNSIKKMIYKTKKKNEYKTKFYYLGKPYDIIYTNSKDVVFGEEKVFINKNIDIDKFLKKQASIIFLERLNYWYNNFKYDIPYPTLTIRKMKSRWGVCNTKLKRVTLNLELIKKEPCCLDYVIVHELSHFIEPNHSNRFWKIVEDNFKDYKKVRKMLKEN